MQKAIDGPAAEPPEPNHFDVVIVGAGMSGVAAAYHLKTQCPWAHVVIIDAQSSFGGTWHTHRYPGIRSDTDLYTYGFRFKPWNGPPIATAAEILAYMGEVIEENGIGPHIRYGHTVRAASWSSNANRWTIEVTRDGSEQALSFSAGFLWMCQGYYRHGEGHMPQWEGLDDFGGEIVHPETWPDDVSLADKAVVVIGSGATAATLVPAIADECGSLTLLQRSPTFFRTGRNVNQLAQALRDLGIDEAWVHETVRRKTLQDTAAFIRRCEIEPDAVKRDLIDNVRTFLGPDYDVATHFTPTYRPWRQRVAFVPEGDLFKVIAAGKATVVTDRIDRFTPAGIQLASGRHLPADVVVPATGFNLNVMGDIAFVIDDRPLVWSETITYRGMMFTGVPNLAWVFGYFRAGWTLRADLVGDFVCRLLNHMRASGAKAVEAALRPEDADMPLLPWADAEGFNPGYLMRGMHLLPRSGPKPEWRHTQDYWSERDVFPTIDLVDPIFAYR